MMKLYLKLFAASILLITLSSCIHISDDAWKHANHGGWHEQEMENKRIINQLEINDTRIEVIAQLGAPDFSEAFSKNNMKYRILFYRTQRMDADGITTKDETTPLVFENDRLVGWGAEALSSIR